MCIIVTPCVSYAKYVLVYKFSPSMYSFTLIHVHIPIQLPQSYYDMEHLNFMLTAIVLYMQNLCYACCNKYIFSLPVFKEIIELLWLLCRRSCWNFKVLTEKNIEGINSKPGFFGSYSQMQIVSFFPIHRKKFPIESYDIKKLNNFLNVFETWTTSLIQY